MDDRKDTVEITREMAILRDAAKHAFDLLSDPQPEVFTWNEQVRNSSIDLQNALCSLGCTPSMCGIQLPEHLK